MNKKDKAMKITSNSEIASNGTRPSKAKMIKISYWKLY